MTRWNLSRRNFRSVHDKGPDLIESWCPCAKFRKGTPWRPTLIWQSGRWIDEESNRSKAQDREYGSLSWCECRRCAQPSRGNGDLILAATRPYQEAVMRLDIEREPTTSWCQKLSSRDQLRRLVCTRSRRCEVESRDLHWSDLHWSASGNPASLSARFGPLPTTGRRASIRAAAPGCG